MLSCPGSKRTSSHRLTPVPPMYIPVSMTDIRRAVLGTVFLVLLFAAAIGRSPEVASAKRPNIIVIQTDDQAANLVKAEFRSPNGSYGKVMPNTRKEIFRRGTEFRNYYATTPVCSPSRASLLTGQYPRNNGLVANEGPIGGWQGFQQLPLYTENVPVSMQRAGYRTAHFGKLINGYYDSVHDRVETTVPPGWNRWFTTAFLPGTQYYGYRVNDNGWPVGPFGTGKYKSSGKGLDSKKCTAARITRPKPGLRCNYLTDVMSRGAVREIRRKHQSPFFIQVDYQAPHGDVAAPMGPQPASRHMNTANRTRLPRPANFNESDITDKSLLIQSFIQSPLSSSQIRNTTKSYRRTLEALRAVDDGVGAIIKTLRQTGQLDNTYIFYTSDHGYFQGEHRFSSAKFLPYEETSSVDMAVRGPDVSRRSKSQEVVGNIDIAATALKLAGAAPDYSVDGRTLHRYWKDPDLTSRRAIEISLLNPRGSGDQVNASISAKAPALRYKAFRVGPYKYVKYAQGDIELYDLERDPRELDNVADAPEYSEVLAYMQTYLPSLVKCAGSECREDLPEWPEPAISGP